MTPDQLAQAVEPFYTTKEREQGSGLGLSMVFGFCEHAGGEFRLASKAGIGTRATIILPFEDQGSRNDAQVSDSASQPSTGQGTILVVEDEERVCKLAGRYLKELGYDVLTADNGERAIEILQSNPLVNLMLSDIVMPGKINCEDLYRWVKKRCPDVKVLLTTGRRSAELKDLVEKDIPITLLKPYTKEQLATAIRDAFSI